MSRITPLPLQLTRRPFSVPEARHHLVGRGRLRGKDLTSPFRGVRRSGDGAQDLLERCREFATLMTKDEFFSHTTALALLDFPMAPVKAIHVCACAPRRARRTRGVIGHQMDAEEVLTYGVAGLSVIDPALAWCQCATSMNLRALVVIGDALLCRQHPWVTAETLERRVREWSGKRGARQLRAAAELVRSGTDSPQETLLRLDVIDFGLPDPEVNGEIRDHRGNLLAIADLLWREYRVILEYDGEQHRTDHRQFARDVDRLNDLTTGDWRVLRINRSHDARRRRETLAQVRTTLLARGWRP